MDKGFQRSWSLILITICILLGSGVLYIIPLFQRNPYVFMTFGEGILIVPVLMGILMLKRQKSPDASLFEGFSPKLIPVLVVVPFVMQNFFMYLTLPVHGGLYELLGEPEQGIEAAANLKIFLMQIVAVCIVPAFVEELLCRGVIMQMLKPYGITVMMTVSASMFAILHFDLQSFIILFMLGMLMSAVKILTGSIWACVLIHFSNNLWAMITLILSEKGMENFLMVLNLVSVVFFPICVYIILKKCKNRVIGISFEKSKKPGFSLSMFFCIGLFLLFTVPGIFTN